MTTVKSPEAEFKEEFGSFLLTAKEMSMQGRDHNAQGYLEYFTRLEAQHTRIPRNLRGNLQEMIIELNGGIRARNSHYAEINYAGIQKLCERYFPGCTGKPKE